MRYPAQTHPAHKHWSLLQWSWICTDSAAQGRLRCKAFLFWEDELSCVIPCENTLCPVATTGEGIGSWLAFK